MTDRDYDNAKIAPAKWSRWQDWVNLLIGIWVAAAPFVLSPTSNNYQMAGLWLGIPIALVALWALAKPTSKTAEYILIVLGALLALSPLIDFERSIAVWNAIISGGVVLILAAWALSTIRNVVVVDRPEDIPRQ